MRYRAMWFACILLSMTVQVMAQGPVQVRSLDVKPGPDRAQIVLNLSGTVRTDVFFLDQPTRLVLNLYGAQTRIQRLPRWPRSTGVKTIRVVQFEKCPLCIVRVVLELEGLPAQWSHRLETKDGRLTLALSRQSRPQGPASGPASGSPSVSTNAEYRLGPGDLLDIHVFELPVPQMTLRVAPDGSISIVPLGRITVTGMTPRELERYLREALQRGFIKDPHVAVNVREFQSQRFTVIGAVNNPGSFPLLGPQTILSALAQAGGLREGAGLLAYLYRRTEEGRYQRLPVDLNRLLNEGDLSGDYPLQAGDILSVPTEEIRVFIYGAVRSPGVVRGSQPFTILRALAAAGGPADHASLGKVRVIHADGKIEKVNIGAILDGKAKDLVLKNGDVVFVPEKFL